MKRKYYIELRPVANVICMDMANMAAYANGGLIPNFGDDVPVLEAIKQYGESEGSKYPTIMKDCSISIEGNVLRAYRENKLMLEIEERDEFQLPTLPD